MSRSFSARASSIFGRLRISGDRTVNPEVAGSNPVDPAIHFHRLATPSFFSEGPIVPMPGSLQLTWAQVRDRGGKTKRMMRRSGGKPPASRYPALPAVQRKKVLHETAAIGIHLPIG